MHVTHFIISCTLLQLSEPGPAMPLGNASNAVFLFTLKLLYKSCCSVLSSTFLFLNDTHSASYAINKSQSIHLTKLVKMLFLQHEYPITCVLLVYHILFVLTLSSSSLLVSQYFVSLPVSAHLFATQYMKEEIEDKI